MSSFLCFICHNAVTSDTKEETRDKYREIVGLNLCPDSHFCYVCCHLINKLWMFKSVCLKRSLEYPVLFSEKCTINLHRSDIETIILCDQETCLPTSATKLYHRYNNYIKDQSNDYVELEDEHNDYEDKVNVNDFTAFNESSHTDVTIEHFESTIDKYDSVNENYEDNENNDVDKNECNDYEVKFEITDDKNDEVLRENVNDNDELVEESETSNEEVKEKTNEEKHFVKTLLSVEDQKLELETQRRSKKYLDAEFKCYNCAVGFLFKDSYQAHMMRHEESNGERQCPLCTLRFASTAVLRAHSSVHSERYICSVCDVTVRKRQRDTHARKCHTREEDSAACHLCGNVFQDASGLQQHIKRFHMSKTSHRTYACNVCGKNYNNQAAVRTHMIKHIQRKFSCDQCSSHFSSPYTLTQHKKKHAQTSEDSVNNSHICVSCGVSYSTRKSLLAHMRTAAQHQDRVYDCPICGRICPNSNALSAHISRVHSTTKDFVCAQCNHKFTSRKSLLRHMREHEIKSKVKIAQCHLCGKNFKGNSKLNRHIKEVCSKEKLEEQLSAYQEIHEQQNAMLQQL